MKLLAVERFAANKKTHPGGWANCEQLAGDLAGFASRPNAAGTMLHLRRLAVLDNRDRLQIWVEAAARVPLREADRVTKGRAFAAVSAFCHERMPPRA